VGTGVVNRMPEPHVCLMADLFLIYRLVFLELQCPLVLGGRSLRGPVSVTHVLGLRGCHEPCTQERTWRT
jgi:hypothetical protein